MDLLDLMSRLISQKVKPLIPYNCLLFVKYFIVEKVVCSVTKLLTFTTIHNNVISITELSIFLDKSLDCYFRSVKHENRRLRTNPKRQYFSVRHYQI